MRRSTFVATLVLGAACNPRTPAHGVESPPDPLAPIPPAELAEVFLQETRALRFAPAERFERALHPPALYPTLGQLAAAERWGIAPCAADTCPDVLERARATDLATRDVPTARRRGDPIRELRLVATPSTIRCTWRLVARTARGWLPSHELGDSARGCVAPFDAQIVEPDVTPYFPLAFETRPEGLRIDATTADYEPGDWETRRLRRTVTLCRAGALGPDTVACTAYLGPTRDQPVLVANAHALMPDPAFAPLSELDLVGTERLARWFAAPSAEPMHDLLAPLRAWHEAAARELPLDAAHGVLVLRTASAVAIALVHQGEAVSLAEHYADYANETIALEATSHGDGVVRVALMRRSEGPTTITWTWEEIITARWHFRLATGVALAVDGAPIGAWRRALDVDRDGLTLGAREGSLAWFRGTGRFTWDGLARRLPEHELAFARAWEAVRAPRVMRDPMGYGKERVAELALVPGFIEPLDRPIVDLARPTPR